MVNIFSIDGWNISLDKFYPEYKRLAESIFTLGNGHMGLRGFFEENYSGDGLQGTYLAGVYYPDKTKVGWWKNGFTKSFAKVVNSTNWAGIEITICGEPLDLYRMRAQDFNMTLNMKTGLLTRSFVAVSGENKKTRFLFKRFLSMDDRNIACFSVSAKPLNYDGKITFEPYLDGDVVNEDSNYGEKFWKEISRQNAGDTASLTMETLMTQFRACSAMSVKLLSDRDGFTSDVSTLDREKFVGRLFQAEVCCDETIELQKIVAVCTSRDFDKNSLEKTTLKKLNDAVSLGWETLFNKHCAALLRKWNECDVIIDGDEKAQQSIRYNIYQLNQTYTGDDPRLNLGPKGFSGEKYGGSTYWDTEAFCLPFYLYTNAKIARNLLYYRYLHLEKARENAKRLGLRGALYPMVTMDGEECHNEWEITFEELHRNGAIAYSIYNYTQYTGDYSYLDDYGIEELIEISRFYASRVTYNPRRKKYMMLGVTGPNEYENNVNNNWYTNMITGWTLDYTASQLDRIKNKNEKRYNGLADKLKLQKREPQNWKNISENMYYPYIKELGIFEQQDLYMDKEQQLVKDIPKNELPINKHWSWDKILRSCFIKQADVIQAFYFFPFRFDKACVKRNFDFYEPRTVHESSLSPSVYSIVASSIGYRDKAYALYLRTSRLDLDNYNDDTDDGIHLTSMTGSWLAIVQGFAGIYVRDDRLTLNPYIPEQWTHYGFKMDFRGRGLLINVTKCQVSVVLQYGSALDLMIFGAPAHLLDKLTVEMPKKVSGTEALP